MCYRIAYSRGNRWRANNSVYGVPQEFIEQLKNEGNLGKNSLLLSNITPDDLIMLQQLKDELSYCLKIEKSETLTDLEPLTAFDHLTCLDLYLPHITDLSPLARLSNVTRLTIRNGSFSTVDFLNSLTNLEEIEFVRPPIEVTDYSGLAGKSNLRKVTISFATLHDLADLQQAGIQHLDLYGSTLEDPSAIGTMSDLTSLILATAKISDWDFLKTVTTLQNLILADTDFSDLRLLSEMQELAGLDISKTTITHPEILTQLPNLNTLNIQETQGIDDLSLLKDIPKLGMLTIAADTFPQEQIYALKSARSGVHISAW
jgi:internalin A